MNKFFKIISQLVAACLVLLALMLILTMANTPWHLKSYVVSSGSMQPAIKVGSLVFVMPANSYKVGDVITFGQKNQVPTTHRIVEIGNKDGVPTYKTKGDANKVADEREVPQSEVIGRMFINLPYVGYVIDLAKQPLGFAILVVIPAVILIFDELKKIFSEVRKMRKSEAEVVEKETEN